VAVARTRAERARRITSRRARSTSANRPWNRAKPAPIAKENPDARESRCHDTLVVAIRPEATEFNNHHHQAMQSEGDIVEGVRHRMEKGAFAQGGSQPPTIRERDRAEPRVATEPGASRAGANLIRKEELYG